MTAIGQDKCALALSLDMGGSGLRVAIKDCIDIEGVVTACGSAALKSSAPAAKNAAVVDHVLSSNCHIIGKANMHELAFGMTGVNAAFGTPLNPKWPDRIPGGSSSGSAVAVAAGLCDFAIGTDTGGSVRQPAICCGLYGIKPTFGRISRDGCHPLQSSLDCIGVFARSASMLTSAMAAIDPSFETHDLTEAPKMARVKCEGYDQALGDELIYALMEGLSDASYLELPHMTEAFEAGMTLIGSEAYEAFGPLLEVETSEGAGLGEDVQARLKAAQNISAKDRALAEDIRQRFSNEVDEALRDFDVLITPALPMVPPTLTEAKDPSTVLPLTRYLRPFNLSGHPAIVLPTHIGPEKLPGGIQIIGRKGEDAYLCAVAEWLSETLTAFQQEDSQ